MSLLVQNVLFRPVEWIYSINWSMWWHIAMKWQLGRTTSQYQPRQPHFNWPHFHESEQCLSTPLS